MLAIEAVWATSRRPRSWKVKHAGFLAVLWVIWCVNMRGVFWIGIYLLALPAVPNAVGRAVASFTGDPSSFRGVLIIRSARAVDLSGCRPGWRWSGVSIRIRWVGAIR